MANDTEVGLIWRLRTQGTQQVQADLRRLTGGVTQARTAAQIAPNVTGWNTALGSVKTQAVGLLGTFGKLAGFAGIGAGMFGLNAVRKDFMALDAALLEIQNSQGLTDDQTASLGRRFHDMGYEAGKSAAEIATLADSVSDLHVQWNRALEAAPKLDLYAQSINLQDTEAVGKTFSGLEQIGGGKIPVMRQIAMMREMQRSTPMSEADFMQATAKSSGAAAAVGGLTGEAGIRSFGGIIATLGKTYALQSRKIQGGMDQLIDVFQDETLKAAIKGLGVDTTDVGTMFEGLLLKLKDKPRALDGIEGLADEFKIIMAGAVSNVETFRSAQRQITGNTQALGADLERTGKSAAVSFGRAIESLKTALEPIVMRLADWVGENQEKIARIGEFLARLGSWAASNGQTVLAFFAALAIRARLPASAGGGPMFPAAGGFGGMMPMVPMGVGGGGGGGGTRAASSGMPPWLNGSQAQADYRAYQAAQVAAARGSSALGLAAGAAARALGPMAIYMFAANEAIDLFSRAVSGKFGSGKTDALEAAAQGYHRTHGVASRTGAAAAMVATAVATNDSMQRAIHDAMAQLRIAINIQAQVSPDGIATRATAQQDSRSAATPVVRVNNNRANV